MGLIWDGLLVHINVENMGCRPLSQVTKSVRLDDVGTLCLCAVLHLAKDCKVVAQWVSHAGVATTAAGKAWSIIDSDIYSCEWHPLKHQQRGITKGTMGINHQISKHLNLIKPNDSNPSFGVDHGSTWGISYNYHQLAILITNMIVNHHMCGQPYSGIPRWKSDKPKSREHERGDESDWTWMACQAISGTGGKMEEVRERLNDDGYFHVSPIMGGSLKPWVSIRGVSSAGEHVARWEMKAHGICCALDSHDRLMVPKDWAIDWSSLI